ncbi:MAG: hypothetical protein EBY17_14945 [Acidobacteriia bacterium]|jgi:hypothetical protein|nr:hypothetical protein [Terriglobia bacterium]
MIYFRIILYWNHYRFSGSSEDWKMLGRQKSHAGKALQIPLNLLMSRGLPNKRNDNGKFAIRPEEELPGGAIRRGTLR